MEAPVLRWSHLVSLSLLLFVSACNRSVRDSIVYSESASIGIVKNGTAYDRAVFALDGKDTIVLPSRAKVLRSEDGTDVVIELAKTLGYMGHPVERTTIDEVRDDMGCVSRVDGGKVYIATFGEAMTPGGGRSIALTVHIPIGVRVEHSDADEMNRSARVASSPLRQRESDGMFATEGSDEVWTLVADEPDAEAAAQQRTGAEFGIHAESP